MTEPLTATTGPGQTPGDVRRPAVSLIGVTRRFRSGAETVWAVREATLQLARGEFACVLGASGSGKTTLLNLAAGLDSPDEGTVWVGTSDLNRLSEAGRSKLRLTEIGVVFQDNNLIAEFTAVENVMLPIEVQGVQESRARRLAEAQLARVGLAGMGQRLPSHLSGGQQQRVGIARALVGDRKILLADEPTGALDTANSRALFELFANLCSQGASVLLATHDPLSRDYVHTLYEMTDGRIGSAAQA